MAGQVEFGAHVQGLVDYERQAGESLLACESVVVQVGEARRDVAGKAFDLLGTVLGSEPQVLRSYLDRSVGNEVTAKNKLVTHVNSGFFSDEVVNDVLGITEQDLEKVAASGITPLVGIGVVIDTPLKSPRVDAKVTPSTGTGEFELLLRELLFQISSKFPFGVRTWLSLGRNHVGNVTPTLNPQPIVTTGSLYFVEASQNTPFAGTDVFYRSDGLSSIKANGNGASSSVAQNAFNMGRSLQDKAKAAKADIGKVDKLISGYRQQ